MAPSTGASAPTHEACRQSAQCARGACRTGADHPLRLSRQHQSQCIRGRADAFAELRPPAGDPFRRARSGTAGARPPHRRDVRAGFRGDLTANRTHRLERRDVEESDILMAMEIDHVVGLDRRFPEHRDRSICWAASPMSVGPTWTTQYARRGPSSRRARADRPKRAAAHRDSAQTLPGADEGARIVASRLGWSRRSSSS